MVLFGWVSPKLHFCWRLASFRCSLGAGWGRKSRSVNHWDRFVLFSCQIPGLKDLCKCRTSAGPVLVYVTARCFQHHSQLGWILSLVSCKRRDFLLSQGPPELLCKAKGFLFFSVKTGRTPSVRDVSEAPSGGSVLCWLGFQPFPLSSPLP